MIDALIQKGWRLRPIVLGKRELPLSLEGDVRNLAPEVKLVYFHPRSLELGHSYLQSLNPLETLKTRGNLYVFVCALYNTFQHNQALRC